MKLELQPEEFQNILTAIAKEELKRSGIKSRTGSLLRSIQVVVEGTKEEPVYVLEFNDYGLFLDAGVQGRLGGQSGAGYDGSVYKFDGGLALTNPGLAKPGTGFGIKPRPWIANALEAISIAAAEGFEQQITPEIEKMIVQTIENYL